MTPAIKRKRRKINIILITGVILYSVLLFLSTIILGYMNDFNSNLKKTLEQSWRQQARMTLNDVINKLDYEVKQGTIDPNNIEQVAKWCKINYSGIRNGGDLSDGFVVELYSERIIEDKLIDASKDDSCIKYLDEIQIDNNDYVVQIQSVVDKIKLSVDSGYGDNNYWISNNVEEWLEWKIYPMNTLGDDGYLTKDDTISSKNNKYVFVLGTNSDEIYSYYNNIFITIEMVNNIVSIILAVALASLISFILYTTYTEFNKENVGDCIE